MGSASAPERTQHRARVVWEGSRDDLRAHRIELAEETILGSTMPANGGDPRRADPEQLLVGALSACHMLWFIALARGRRLRISSYSDEATGTLEGGRITKVVLAPEVGFETEPGPEVLSELHHEAHEHCDLAASVNFPVEVAA